MFGVPPDLWRDGGFKGWPADDDASAGGEPGNVSGERAAREVTDDEAPSP